jgi:pimeloyl-ACP methyl ester carboxylesterase/DNA-binding CsgD family transcriptional regulator
LQNQQTDTVIKFIKISYLTKTDLYLENDDLNREVQSRLSDLSFTYCEGKRHWIALSRSIFSYGQIALVDKWPTVLEWYKWQNPRSMDSVGAGDDVLVLLSRDAIQRRILNFAKTFGLTEAQTQSLLSLYITCDTKAAATSLGISYETIREHLEAGRHATGTTTLARYLMISIVGCAVDVSLDGESDKVFQQVFGLTERQMRIAALVANGSTRRESAEILGISDAVAKMELSNIFVVTDTRNGLELARALAETRVLASFTSNSTSIDLHPSLMSNTIKLQHTDGRNIAISDYGPITGLPTIVMHSSSTTRPVNRALVEALQKNGFRPISIDRPGFGDSSPLGADHEINYFDVAADDMAFVCRSLGFQSVHVITRGAAHIASAFAVKHNTLLKRMTIINPDPDSHASHLSKGIIPQIKRNFMKRPMAIEAMAHILARLASFERVKDSLMRLTKDCAADAAAMRDPANIHDYYRSVEAMKHGRVKGYVSEQRAFAVMQRPDPIKHTTKITLMIGDHDFIHNPSDTIAYWTHVLPDASMIIVEGGGRFLTYSHAEFAVSTLRAAEAQHPPNGYDGLQI